MKNRRFAFAKWDTQNRWSSRSLYGIKNNLNRLGECEQKTVHEGLNLDRFQFLNLPQKSDASSNIADLELKIGHVSGNNRKFTKDSALNKRELK
jgi:hypothetical protein